MVSRTATTHGISRTSAACILICFAIVAAICLVLPILSFVEMVSAIAKRATSITIDKGVYYLFGVGLAFSFLIVDGVYNTVLRRPIGKAAARLVNRIAIAGLILIVVLPNIIHLATAHYLENSEYQFCQVQSSQWLFLRDIVYTHGDSCR